MPFKDLAYRFSVSTTTVSRIFAKWLMIMDVKLSSCLIKWPDRESLWKTMPQCYRLSFGKKVAVIVDCFEVFVERPSSLLARVIVQAPQHRKGFTWDNTSRHSVICV